MRRVHAILTHVRNKDTRHDEWGMEQTLNTHWFKLHNLVCINIMV